VLLCSRFKYWSCSACRFRTSIDNSPSFVSAISNMMDTVPWMNISQPDCWAYADALEIGAPISANADGNSCAPHRMSVSDAEASFAMWAVTSQPLILSFDVRNTTEYNTWFPIVSNRVALAINSLWAGSAGMLVAQSQELWEGTVHHGAACEVASVRTLPVWTVWSKPLNASAVAVVAVNTLNSSSVAFSVPLATLGLPPAMQTAAVSDVWTGKPLSAATGGQYSFSLCPSCHVFLVFSLPQSMPCSENEDCNMNGVCAANGTCLCRPGWVGVDCGQLDIQPAKPRSQQLFWRNHTSSWSASVAFSEVDGMWHVFLDYIANHCGISAYLPNAFLAHGVAAAVTGPYSNFSVWQTCFSNTPHHSRHPDGSFVVWHSGSGGYPAPPDACNVDPQDGRVRATNAGTPAPFGLHAPPWPWHNCTNGSTPNASSASSGWPWPPTNIMTRSSPSGDPAGPWTNFSGVIEVNVTGSEFPHSTGNPSAYVFPNGTTIVMFRSSPGDIGVMRSSEATWNSSYLLPGETIFGPDGPNTPHLEDTFIYRDAADDGGTFHAIFHSMGGCPSLGCHAFSRDSYSWKLAKSDPYDRLVQLLPEGGVGPTENLILAHRERPELVFNQAGQPAFLINAVTEHEYNVDDHSWSLIVPLGTSWP
jgi:hypothetical protein